MTPEQRAELADYRSPIPTPTCCLLCADDIRPVIEAALEQVAALRAALQAIWPYLQEDECLELEPGYRNAIALCRAQVEVMT
jgi:transposase